MSKVTVRLRSQIYDGLEVTISGDLETVGNWLHENVLVCDAALSVGNIKDKHHNEVLWQHHDPDRMNEIYTALREKKRILVYDNCNEYIEVL